MNWTDKLFQEKTFSSVYLKARKVCSNRVNSGAALATFVLFAIYLIGNHQSQMRWASLSAIITTIRAIGDVGLTVTTQLLGFLIAGFAIFASITKPEIFILLANLPHTKGDITRLQFIFFNFLFVFIHFILLLSASVFVKVALPPGGPLSGVLQSIGASDPHALSISAAIFLCGISAWLVFILMLLKSFIWNMYQSILLAIAADAELRAKQSQADNSQK
jgi:hypothetical protein